jgi:plastocyanin
MTKSRNRWLLAAVAITSSALVVALARDAAAGGNGSVTGRVNVKSKGLFGTSSKRDKSGVVVYLENVPGPPPARALVTAKLVQRDKQFVPRVIAVMKGASVEFPNDDKMFHNVFSLSDAAKFDLGLYKSGTSKTVTFDRAGAVDIYCNIHPEMVATIKVVDSGWFAVTGPDGSFRIDGVPPGQYPLVGWVARGTEYRGTVTVKAGGTSDVQLEVVESGGNPRHLRKDGTPYGRYE